MGKSEYSMRAREVLMCSERYADDIPFRLPNTQLPPTLSLFSKQSNGMPASLSLLAAAMPDDPAPITHAVGSVRELIVADRARKRPRCQLGRGARASRIPSAAPAH